MRINLFTQFRELARDIDLDFPSTAYCLKRLSNEGFSFLSKTLPELAKAVLRSLEIGYFDRPTSFQWKRKSLRYFTKFLSKIFDPNTGRLLDNPDPVAIYSIRQLGEYWYKTCTPYTEELVSQYTEEFIKNDDSVPAVGEYDYDWVDQLRKDFETHYKPLSRATVDDVLHSTSVRPGPGTFSGKTQYEKTTGLPWYYRSLYDYSHPDYFSNYQWASKPNKSARGRRSNFKDPGYSEVLFVPKDSRGPRVIVREPFASLRYQMAYNQYVSSSLEHLSWGRINFQSQEVNKELARVSSIDRKMVTLDLSSASDMVSYAIVKHIYRNSPALRFFVNGRTTHALLPDGRIKKLRKLSGMGSGLTFPTMALLIHLTITRAIVNSSSYTYKQARKLVYVYGDDIVAPRRFYDCIQTALCKVGLVLNRTKSYSRGFFRESCGGDYYYGNDVTPIRFRMQNSDLVIDGLSLNCKKLSESALQLERHARELRKAGLYNLAEYYYTLLERDFGKLPWVCGESPVLGRYSILPYEYPVDSTGHYVKVRVIVPQPKKDCGVGKHRDPYIYLNNALNSCGGPLAWLDGKGKQSYDEVSIPRYITLKRQRVSAFRLMG